MQLNSLAWIVPGIAIGAIATVVATPFPTNKYECGVYKVRYKTATSYALKPPPAEKIYEACPQTTQKIEKPQALETAENVSEPETTKTDESRSRRHKRHHRVRRYWR